MLLAATRSRILQCIDRWLLLHAHLPVLASGNVWLGFLQDCRSPELREAVSFPGSFMPYLGDACWWALKMANLQSVHDAYVQNEHKLEATRILTYAVCCKLHYSHMHVHLKLDLSPCEL